MWSNKICVFVGFKAVNKLNGSIINVLEVISCHSDPKSYGDTNIDVRCASCKRALGVKSWHSSTPLQYFHRCQSSYVKNKALLSVLTVSFLLLLEYDDTDCERQQADGIRTEISMRNPTLPMVRKVFKEHRNSFFVCVGAASQLLKIYRTITTGLWKPPRDEFRLLLSG